MSKFWNIFSAITMVALLMLLTIGLPITFNAVNQVKERFAHTQSSDDNPYSSSTEEKTPNAGLTVTEEYVHDSNHDFGLSPFQISIAYIHAHEATYVAYHGELHCPPPNFV